jgi:glycosyltransferase involved in cell wall biosynthesis
VSEAEARPRSVVYVSPLPPPAGGIGTWTRTLVTRGLPAGLHPVVVDTSPGPGRDVFERAGLVAETRRAVRVLWRFARALLHERPAFVHVNVDPMALGFYRDALCAALARLAGVPVAIHYRGLVSRLEDHPEHVFHRWAVRRAARLVDLNLVLNEPSGSALRRLAGDVRVEQVANYYDDRAMPDREVAGRAAGEPLRLAYTGGLTRAKGIPEILSMAARLPDVEVHLIGSRYPETAAALDAAPSNVHEHGELAHPEVLQRMASCHVLVFPTRHREGFPNAVCEAMALGLAVVASPVGAIPEMVEQDRGGLLVPSDPEALEAAVRRLREDDALRVSMGRYNQGKARRLYAYDRVVEQLVALYQSCERG